jgi:hypothetical protein
MSIRQHTRRFFTMAMLAMRIACLAILLAALAPSVSRMLTAAGATPAYAGLPAQICSAADNVYAQAGFVHGTAGKTPAKPSMLMADCPCCSMHADTFGLPPANKLQLLPVASRSSYLPPLFYQAPRTPFMWAPAQSRAPPRAA